MRKAMTVRRRSVHAALLAVVMIAAVFAGASPAAADTGDLTPIGCVNEGGTDGCAAGAALSGARKLAISPDGTSVYATSTDGGGAVLTFDRATATGPDYGKLTQKAGAAGCTAETTFGTCGIGRGLTNAFGVAVSPDGLTVYVTAFSGDAIAIFDRAADGTLTQKGTTAGCIGETSADGCFDGRALDEARDVVVSSDGTSVYVASGQSHAVAVFDRAINGVLTQKADAAGCVAEDDSAGCTDGNALQRPLNLALSRDGKSLYATSDASFSVAIFDRAADGTIVQKPGTAGCVADDGSTFGCTDVRSLGGPIGVAISSDGKSAYVAVIDGAVDIFDRASDGSLAQRAGTEGCIRDDGADGCADGRALQSPQGVAVGPDGSTVYVASSESDAIAVLDRTTTGKHPGALTQSTGIDGCVSDNGSLPTGGACVDGPPLDNAFWVIVSPVGSSVYASASNSSAISAYSREAPPVPCSLTTPTIVGTGGSDGMNGGTGDDIMFGLGGNDSMWGNDGQDVICGGSGNDKLRGFEGRDLLDGQSGKRDSCTYEPGIDVVKHCERKKSGV